MRSLRTKLTLYYLAILSAVLIFFGFAIYTYLSRSLISIIDDALVYEVKEIEHKMMSGFAGYQAEEPLQEADSEQMIIAPQIVQIIDSEGEVRDESGTLANYHLPVQVKSLKEIKGDKPNVDTTRLASGEEFTVVTKRATSPDGDVFFIRVAQSLRPLQQARRRLILLLAIAVPIALLLGSYGGLLLANQALRPVDEITSAAEHISASDLSQRVPQPEEMDEIGRLAQTFNHMIGRLEAAFERQRQFTSDASHEMRTPLAVMRGDIEIALRRERTPEEYQRVLTSNLEETIRLSRLVEDLLTLARGDAGQSNLRWEPVILDKLCNDTIEYLKPLAEERGQLLVWVQPEIPVVINGDAQRLKQLLLNLLDNAIKYTGPGGTVTMNLDMADKEAVMTITDTGRGIPAADVPHIFDRFFRHSRSTSDKTVQGFGLGLAIVKWIVDSHNGSIEATSEPEKGTTFTVRLPLPGQIPESVTAAVVK